MGLKERPDLRANILVPTTGVRAKIATKKSAESAGMDLQIALDEGETDPALIVSLFHPDDRVRYLDKGRLWKYIIEPQFWKTDGTDTNAFKRSKSHVAFMLDRAIEDRMLTYRDIVEGITVAKLVNYLPVGELQSVIERALTNSHTGKVFTEEDLLHAVPAKRLVEHVPLTLVWDSVMHSKVAVENGLTEETGTTPKRPSLSASSRSGAETEIQNLIGSTESTTGTQDTTEESSRPSREHAPW